MRRWKIVSWIVWMSWLVFGLAWELWTVWREKKDGTMPLTRILRDTLMKKSAVFRLLMMGGLVWLCLHFLVGGSNPVPW